MSKIKIFTIGFTKKSAEDFFTMLRDAGIKRIIDVRLSNTSQLAGFTKRDDLRYFLKKICNIEYLHLPELAPTKDILNDYTKTNKDWTVYRSKFRELITTRKIEEKFSKDIFNFGCLLCSEEKPHHCHRSLIAEYLNEKWGNLEIKHLV